MRMRKISADGIVLCKDSLDELLRTVEQNNHVEIRNAVATFYDEMSSMGMNGKHELKYQLSVVSVYTPGK